ncbi:MAG: hypothetical protein LH473_14075 [Chitinophagales bacterium]|nr:hypothetical protein [Chitinophagales bacterium]
MTATTPLIKRDDIVLYEIFVRNFSAEGTLNAIVPQLDRLKNLGVNVLWLMPIQPTGKINHKGTYGSPYSISNFTEINTEFGTKEDFKNLVDSIHAKGMFVILDEVANHTAWDNPWITKHPEWYTKDSSGKIIWPAGTDWNDVADLNYDNKELWQAKINTLKYWIQNFNIDGYRCDMAGMVPDDFWKEAIDTIRKIRPLILIAESDKPEMYENGFDITYGWKMYHQLKHVWQGDSSSVAVDHVLKYEADNYSNNYKALRFITNHDENSWDDVPQNKFTNIEGSKAAFVTILTLPGVALVYQGQEIGYPTKINLFEKYNIDWNANPELQQWYSNILKFYNGNEILKKGALAEFSVENEKALIYQRKILGKDPLWVIINTRNEEITITLPPSLQNKKLLDIFSNVGMETTEVMKLQPHEYHIVEAH